MSMELTLVTNRPKFNNMELEKATILLSNCDSNIRRYQFTIAATLAKIENSKLYTDDGFDSCAEYAMQTFGMKKTLAYNLIDIGTNYTRAYHDKKGKIIGYCSNLLPACDSEIMDAPLIDFTPNKISRFKSLGREKVLEMVNNGELTPQMTTREIDDVVKLNTAIPAVEGEPIEAPEQSAESPEQSAESTEQTVEVTEPIRAQLEEERPDTYDNINTAFLVAELRARGFIVYQSDGKELIIDWKKA